MKTEAVIFALCLCVGSAVAQQVKRAGLKETVFRSTADKPATTIHVTPADAAAFWKRLDPPDLADKPTELDEFRRVHAHKFWEPYADQKITVSGAHYCYCCFKAAIGVSGFATGNSGRGYLTYSEPRSNVDAADAQTCRTKRGWTTRYTFRV